MRSHQYLPHIGSCVALLVLPLLGNATRYQPETQWLQTIKSAEPLLPYRLGVVEFKEGTSDEWLEYMGDLRATLKASNYFQTTPAPRLKLKIERSYQTGDINEDGCKTTAGSLALTYRFYQGAQEVSRFSITTQAPIDGDSNDFNAAMAANLKLLLLELRKSSGDVAFSAQANSLESAIQQQLMGGSNFGCTVGVALANGFVATVEGTMDVVSGMGEVAGAALEVAASPEFQNTLNTEMANYQAQQAQQTAYLNDLQAQANAQAEAEQRQQQAEQQAEQQAQQAQQQAGREALAKQLADGIAYRNLQISKTTDLATLQQLKRDNAAAMQAAQQIGMYSQVDIMATQGTQAGYDEARAQRSADEQAERQRLAAEQVERDRLQREQEAAQRAEQQRLAAEKAAQEREERQRLLQQEAEERRLAAERAEQQKKQAWSNWLAAYKSSIRLGAKQCDGKDKPYRLIGDRPSNPLPKEINYYSECISVRYEARCPGTPRGSGIQSTQYNFTGMGLGCLSAESLMPQRLACKDDDVIVETLDVTGCGG